MHVSNFFSVCRPLLVWTSILCQYVQGFGNRCFYAAYSAFVSSALWVGVLAVAVQPISIPLCMSHIPLDYATLRWCVKEFINHPSTLYWCVQGFENYCSAWLNRARILMGKANSVTTKAHVMVDKVLSVSSPGRHRHRVSSNSLSFHTFRVPALHNYTQYQKTQSIGQGYGLGHRHRIRCAGWSKREGLLFYTHS